MAKQTIRRQVLDALEAEFPYTLTNQQLATRLGLNEPSVRVVTKQFADEGLIYAASGGYSNIAIDWRLNESYATDRGIANAGNSTEATV